MPEPLQNRFPKRVVFQHRFFRVLASILEVLGPPRWSQVGLKIDLCVCSLLFLSLLNLKVLKNSVLEGSRLDFGGSRGSILEALGSIFRGFGRRKQCLEGFLGGKHFATDLSHVIGPFLSQQRWARCSRSGVAGGVPPLGAFNPPATEGVPTAC